MYMVSSGAADGAIAHVTMLGCWVASTLGCMPACGQLGSCGSVEAGAKAIGEGVGWYEAAVGAGAQGAGATGQYELVMGSYQPGW